MGQSFGVPDDIDEDDLMGELDALEDELAQESEHTSASGVPSYLQVTDHRWLSENLYSSFCSVCVILVECRIHACLPVMDDTVLVPFLLLQHLIMTSFAM